jgi:hypothetical protein
MRKVLSMAVLLLLAFPLVAPAFGQTAPQHLLLCCRNGAHHCMTITPVDAPMVHARCPAFPKAAVLGHTAAWMAADDDPSAVADSIAPLRIRQVEAGYRISFDRSRQKRGPPAVHLS